jgi:hypothetical protein
VALTIGSVSAVGSLAAQMGITATGQTLALSGQGGIGETSGIMITASSLSAVNITSGNIILDQGIAVGTFAASNTVGSTEFKDPGALTIGSVSAVGSLAAVTGITAPGQTVALSAVGGINETAGAPVAAGSLSLENTTSGNIIIDQGNAVGTLALSNTVGNTAFEDTVALTIGSVSSVGSLAAQTGITATGQTVALSGQGGISEAAGVAITATSLSAVNTASGDIVLNQGNTVPTFAGGNTAPGGKLVFVDSTALAIGTVPAVGSLGAVTGVTTAGGDLAMTTASGDLVVNSIVEITGGSGSITLTSAGNMTVNANAAADTTITNKGSGNLTLNVAQDLTLHEVNSGNTLPDIKVSGNGNIDIHVAGNILPGSPADAATQAMAGIILTNPMNSFRVDGQDPAAVKGVVLQPGNGFVIATGASQVSGIGPRVNSVDATTVSGGAVNIGTNGEVSLTLNLSRANESGLVSVSVNWGDGITTPYTFNVTGASQSVTVTHTYDNGFALTRPDSLGNQTAPIFVTVIVSIPHLTIDPTNVPAFTINGTTFQAATATALQFGLVPNASFYLTDQLQATERQIVRVVQEAVPLPVVPAFPQQPVLVLEQETFGGRVAKDTFGVPILQFIHPDGKSDPKQDQAELTLEQFRELLNKDLRSETWARFPDGHYRIVLKPTRESTTERVVLDVYVRQGKVVDFADLDDEPSRPPAEPESPAAAQPPGGDRSRLEGERPTIENLPAVSPEGPAFEEAASAAAGLPAATGIPPSEPADKDRAPAAQPAESRPLQGAAAIGAALALAGLRRRLEQQADAEQRRADARPLTKAGRLYSRLRRRAAELLNSAPE